MHRSSIIVVAALLALACGPKNGGTSTDSSAATSGEKTHEHAGKEHAGKEHAGKEHGGAAMATATPAAARTYTAADVKNAMNAHIAAETKKGNGALLIKDEKTGENLQLEFVRIHDPVRIIEGKGYFACTDLKPKGAEADKLYDLDFWLKPDASGNLAVYDTKIHKHPEKGADGKWTKKERYTFVNDNPVEVK